MAITISGENNNDRILASDGVLDSISGINAVGVVTATSFTGDLTGDVTGNVTGNLTGNVNNTTLLLQTGGNERLRITSGGDVGIKVTPISGVTLQVGTPNTSTGVMRGHPDYFSIDSGSSAGGGVVGSNANPALIFGGDENTGMYHSAADTLNFTTGGTERLRITSSGGVNIAGNYTQTTAPLCVTTGANSFGIRLMTGSNKVVDILNNNNSGECEIRGYYNNNSGTQGEGFRLEANGTTFFNPGGNQGLQIDTSGNVLAHQTLYISDTIQHIGDTDTKIRFPSNDHITFETAGSERLRIHSNGLINVKMRSAEVRRMILSGSPSNTSFNIEAHDGETGTSSGDVQGKLGLFYNDGSTLTNTANISFIRGSGAPDGEMAFITNQTERLRIHSDGKIDVGGVESGYKFNIIDQSNRTTTAETALLLYAKHDGSGTTGAGFGTGIRFWGDRASGNVEQNMGRIMCTAEVNSGTTLSGQLSFDTSVAGVLKQRLSILSSGIVKFSDNQGTYNNTTQSYTSEAGYITHYVARTTYGGADLYRRMLDIASIGGAPHGSHIRFLTSNNASDITGVERMRIMDDGGVYIGTKSHTQRYTHAEAPALLTVQNGARVYPASGVYAAPKGGFCDHARYELEQKLINISNSNLNIVQARNGQPLTINEARSGWSFYSNLPNYLLGHAATDNINNSSFTLTLYANMTVFLLRTNGWNGVPLTGWTLIEQDTNIAPASSDTRLYVKTLAAGTYNSFDNDSAMYFFVL